MSIELAENLKRDLTDKYVVVDRSVPELKRFAPLTGIVKTVNMNCRALVQFLGTEDISWYDIDPAYLTVVEKPVETRPEPAHAPAAEKKPAAAKPAAKRPAGKSPLELARQQGAAGAAKSEGEGAAKPPGRKLSPLELARQQGAAKSGGQTARAERAPETARKPAEGKKLSPLELARQQGAAKRADAGAPQKAEAEESETAVATAEPEPESGNGQAEPAAEKKKPAATTGSGGRPLSKIELARQQGPAKR